MRPHVALVLAGLLASVAMPGAVRAATVEEGITATLADFKQALSDGDGTAAAAYIDDRTAAFYDKVRRAALRMPEKRLLRQPLFFQAAVLSTRLRFTKPELEAADARAVYARLTTVEVGAPKAIDSISLVRIQPTRAGASAITYVSIGGRSENIGLRIFSQGGSWKIDLTRLIEALGRDLQSRIGLTAKTPAAATKAVIQRDLFPLIGLQTGKTVSPSVWVPLAHAN